MIWPAHVETFGDVGIVLRPRSVASIISISPIDAGSHYDPATGKREERGVPFSGSAVRNTFATATVYNEWTVTNADTIGIFINPCGPLQVAKVVDATKMPGYDPSIMSAELVAAADISIEEIVAALPGLPVYSYCGRELIKIVDAADIYGSKSP